MAGKECCLMTVFWILVGAVSIYILYVGLGIPIQTNNHRLRYNQLVSFEMYSLSITDWNEKDMTNQGISIITYQQQIAYNYQYLLGTFLDNFTVENDTMIIGDLIEMKWRDFTELISKQNESQLLFITMWSQTDCNQSLLICFEDNFPTQSSFYYTILSNEWYVDINSESISNALDDPRDGINFIVLIALIIILILLLSSVPDFGESTFFWIALIFIATYYLWVFILTVIPIQFCIPYNMDNLDYWTEIKYSIAFIVGNYNPLWWITGVILHGLWIYTLLLFLPVMCCFFMLLVAAAECCFACCCQEKADDVGLYILMALITIGLFGIIAMSLGFIVLFIGNLTMWNDETFNNFHNKLVIQALIGLICIWIIFTIFGVIVTMIGKQRKKKEKNKRKISKKFNSFSRSFKKLPLVRNRKKDGAATTSMSYDEAMDEQETIAMTQYDDNNQNQRVVPN